MGLNKIYMELIRNKKIFKIGLPLLLVTGIFLWTFTVRAQGVSWATSVISGLLSILIWGLGIILVLAIQGLIFIASIQLFIGSQVVILGWVIVRDICNMFFVVVLIIIAFGTILHLENYNYKKWLPKLILMAVLINFSKTICGLLIDVTQVVMLTFVNAFKDIGGANLTDMLGISKIVTASESSTDSTFSTIVGAYLLGIIYLLVSIVVIVTMMMMLAMRVVMIWIYVVLSPAAYLLAAFPGGQTYATKWWTDFTKNLIVGPVLAFFIWLSLAALSGGNNLGANSVGTDSVTTAIQNSSGMTTSSSTSAAIAGSQASSPAALIQFVIAIGMLVGGLMISQEIGGAAGSIAGKGMAALQKGQGMATGAAMKGLKWTAKRPLSVASWANDRFLQNKGIADLNLSRVAKNWKQRSEDKKQQKYVQGQTKAGQRIEEGGRAAGAMALTALGEDTFDHLTTLQGIRQTLTGGKRMKKNREKIKNSPELEQAEFEAEYADLDASTDYSKLKEGETDKRTKKRTELRARDVEIDGEINAADAKIKNLNGDIKTSFDPYKKARLEDEKKATEDKRATLLKEKLRNGDKLAYAQQNSRTSYTQEDREMVAAKKDAYQKKMDQNVPMTNYNDKMAEQAGIQKELAKLSLTTDADELNRLLKAALQSKDTAKSSAIMTKMTKDGNDNEFTKVMDKNGDTGWRGMQGVMDEVSNPNSKNYGGFTQQQAYSLGASLCELNKSSKHWEATAGFQMKNGAWEKTSKEDQANISLSESGKVEPQEQTRANGRLAYVKYVKDKIQLTETGLVRLMGIASPGNSSNVRSRMNESAAKNVLPLIADLLMDKNGKEILDKDGNIAYKLKDQFKKVLSQGFVDDIAARLGKITSKDPLEMIAKVKDINLNS
jgi:hypothetical protein